MMTTAKRLLADIRELAPDITARAAEIEAARRIPPDLVETLRSIGVFRLFVPRSHGGLEIDLPTALEIIAAPWQDRRFGRLDRDDRQRVRHLRGLAAAREPTSRSTQAART